MAFVFYTVVFLMWNFKSRPNRVALIFQLRMECAILITIFAGDHDRFEKTALASKQQLRAIAMMRIKSLRRLALLQYLIRSRCIRPAVFLEITEAEQLKAAVLKWITDGMTDSEQSHRIRCFLSKEIHFHQTVQLIA